jgi:hypothetical protein
LGRAGTRLGKNHGPSTTGSDDLIEVAYCALARPQTRTPLPEHAMPEFCQPPLAHVFAPESASVEPLQSIRPRFLGQERMCWTRRVSVRADLGPARRIQPGNLSNVRRQVGIRNRRSYSMSQRSRDRPIFATSRRPASCGGGAL